MDRVGQQSSVCNTWHDFVRISKGTQIARNVHGQAHIGSRESLPHEEDRLVPVDGI
jgi:hypothetical protein